MTRTAAISDGANWPKRAKPVIMLHPEDFEKFKGEEFYKDLETGRIIYTKESHIMVPQSCCVVQDSEVGIKLISLDDILGEA